jgi:hypothetical protein
MKILRKSVLGFGAAAVALAGLAAPLQARDHYNDDGIDAGDVIAGALIIGGLAAILSSGNNRNDRYYDNYRDGYRGNNGGHGYDYQRYGARQAVDQCVRSVEYQASRYGRADVTQITDIDRKSYGYKIEGRVVVQDRYRDYDRYNGYDRDDRGNDEGRFNCYVEQGRVTNIELRGLGGWR